MEVLKKYIEWGREKIGDSILIILDEISFWGEVIAEFMEWDQNSAQRIAEQYRRELRDQIKESDDILSAAKQHIAERNQQEYEQALKDS